MGACGATGTVASHDHREAVEAAAPEAPVLGDGLPPARDEPSNHLDLARFKCLRALLSFSGAVFVISDTSHPVSHASSLCALSVLRHFLLEEEQEPTHVVMVKDGAVSMEARNLREDD